MKLSAYNAEKRTGISKPLTVRSLPSMSLLGRTARIAMIALLVTSEHEPCVPTSHFSHSASHSSSSGELLTAEEEAKQLKLETAVKTVVDNLDLLTVMTVLNMYISSGETEDLIRLMESIVTDENRKSVDEIARQLSEDDDSKRLRTAFNAAKSALEAKSWLWNCATKLVPAENTVVSQGNAIRAACIKYLDKQQEYEMDDGKFVVENSK